ncbi:MAG: KamA family radical SAM protein [Thermoguttaceae bacterium]
MINDYNTLIQAGLYSPAQSHVNSAVKLSSHILSLINRGSLKTCPIAKQFIPDPHEDTIIPGEELDSLGEELHCVGNVLYQKYPNRCVLYVSSVCAAFCRFCTRKRRVEDVSKDAANNYETAFEYLRNTPSVVDVLVTGGDPLMLPPKKLSFFLEKLREIPSVKCVRIGTRLPISDPDRITDEYCEIIARYNVKFVNCQFNHPLEITPETIKSIDRMRKHGISLNNQSVLLKGVNDTVEIMRELCMKLYEVGIRPYYLYQCDLIPGLSHFRTTITKGRYIHSKLRGYISGLAIPFYIVDLPAGMGKVHCTRDNFVEFDPEIVDQGPGVSFGDSKNPTLEYPVRKFFNYQNKSFVYDERKYCPYDLAETQKIIDEINK